MRASPNVMLREIADEHILIPVGEMAMKTHGMINLSESGLLLWKKLQEDCTQSELVACILQEYDVARETAEEDVQVFLNKLNQIGVLENCEER